MNDEGPNAAPPPSGPAIFRAGDRMLGTVGALVLFGMMGLTFVDVVGRYLFNAPLRGSYEFTELGLAVIVFAGFPLVTAQREHVTTALFDNLIRGRMQAFKELSIGLVGIAACAVFAWRLWAQAGIVSETGGETPYWHIKIGPFAYFMAVASVISTAVLGWQILGALRRLLGLEEPPA